MVFLLYVTYDALLLDKLMLTTTFEIVQSPKLVSTFLTDKRLLLTMSQKVTLKVVKSSKVLSTLLTLVFPFLSISRHRLMVSRHRRHSFISFKIRGLRRVRGNMRMLRGRRRRSTRVVMMMLSLMIFMYRIIRHGAFTCASSSTIRLFI
jgi:hypothetical protein